VGVLFQGPSGCLPHTALPSILGDVAAGESLSRWTSTRDALSHRDLRRLLFAVGSWSATEGAFLLGASIIALDLGGPAAVGLVAALRVLPAAISASLISTVADKVSRPLIVAGVNALFAVIAVVTAAVVWSGAALPVLLVVVGVGSAISALLKPSMQAMLPELVRTPEHLLPAHGAWSIANGLGAVIGPATAALLLAQADVGAVFVGLAIAYALTALVTRGIRTEFKRSQSVPTPGRAKWLAPLRGVTLFARPGARAAFALLMLGRVMSGFLSVAIILRATELASTDQGAQVLAGSLMTALGVGSFLGSAATFVARDRHGVRWFAIGAILYGAGAALLGLFGEATPAWILLAVAGAGNAMLWTFGADQVTRLLPDHVAGRGWGAIHGIGAGAYALGSVAAPLLSEQIGLPTALLAVGLVLAASPLLAWRGLVVANKLTTPQNADVTLLGSVPVFAALTGVAVARIACTVEPRRLPAGTTVVSEGESGEEFFVVRSGELVVYQGGHEVRRLGPGDSFGEIALLRTVPRTATVVTASDVELVCVGHELFVASVTGHRSSDAGASARVSAVLDEDRRRSQPDPY